MADYEQEDYEDFLWVMRSEARSVTVGDLRHASPHALRAAALAYAKEQGWTPPDPKRDLTPCKRCMRPEHDHVPGGHDFGR